MDADQGVATRTAMVERAESEDAIMAICHHGGFGRVVRAEGRRYWQLVLSQCWKGRGRNDGVWLWCRGC